MRCLVTGGAGFIGRWVVAQLLSEGHEVLVLDDLSNGRAENLAEFTNHSAYLGLRVADLKSELVLEETFADHIWDRVFHLGASINVQESIDNPDPVFMNDGYGTLRVLEACRKQYFHLNGLSTQDQKFDFSTQAHLLVDRRPRVVVMSTCMVYGAANGAAISESHPYTPASPYASAKIAADMLALSYNKAYGLPVTVVRPFNTYGPFQKSNSEGGVVSIFLKRDLSSEPLLVKGSGAQTRDLLYVEDCADFVVTAASSEGAEGEVINAGTGDDVSISVLAELCRTEPNRVEKVAHDHPQAEIMRLCCDAQKAHRILQWEPQTNLQAGIQKTRSWLSENRWAW